VAVGSEDCSVCLVRVHPVATSHSGASLEVLCTLQGHTSSVRALCTSRATRSLLFSGGARASLKVWSIGELTCCISNVHCCIVGLFHIRGRL
jgi:WD40 repeat protein